MCEKRWAATCLAAFYDRTQEFGVVGAGRSRRGKGCGRAAFNADGDVDALDLELDVTVG